MDYFFTSENWSLSWLLGLGLLGVAYLLLLTTSLVQKILFFVALLLLYLVFGSPVATLPNFGLHGATMFQHMLTLMVVPVLLLCSIPSELFKKPQFDFLQRRKRTERAYLFPWIVGAVAMWGGHFLTSAILSAKTGLAICGVSVMEGSWISFIPQNLILGLLLLAGLIFAMPVFHPDVSRRLAPLQNVAYLFTACVSCSVLGLYVAFSASSAAMAEAVPLLTTLRNPFPMTLRTDQEIAGMLMWVPGCILYVAASVGILLKWYEDESMSESAIIDRSRNPGLEENNWVYMNTKKNDL